MRGVVTRFAPSPTGDLHLGGLRTALFNKLFAMKHGGRMLLRVEDTDRSRLVQGSVERMIEVLQWAGLGVGAEQAQYQSERLPLYEQASAQLLQEGKAYRCFCSSERLATLKKKGSSSLYDRMCLHLGEEEGRARARGGESHVVRLLVPEREEGRTVVTDLIRGKVVFGHSQVDDQVLLKSDGFPTYHLASVVDDHAMHVTHVIRGEEWLPSTVKHVMLYEALGLPMPQFAHLPLLLSSEPGGGKLSKRHAAASAKGFVERGYMPGAVVNFVATLGFTPSREIMSLEELAQDFSLERVSKGGARVDLQKLAWINTHYVKAALQVPEERAQLARLFKSYLPEHVTEEYAARILDTIHDRLSVLSEIAERCSYFWETPPMDPSVDLEAVTHAVQALSRLEGEWTEQSVGEALKGAKFPHLRKALTNSRVGAPVLATIVCLGKDVVMERLERFI